MQDDQRIRAAFERNAKVLRRLSSVGKGTAVTKVRVRDGLTCEVEDGPWKLTADMPEKIGGNDVGPNPGVYGRAALGTCLAIVYVQWAAKRNVPISYLEVEIQADYDTRGIYAVADVPAGYSQVRCVVTVKSDASESEINAMLDEADAHSPYYDVFTRPLDLKRELRLITTQR